MCRSHNICESLKLAANYTNQYKDLIAQREFSGWNYRILIGVSRFRLIERQLL